MKKLTKQERKLRLKWKLWELQGKLQVYREDNKKDSDILLEEIKETINQIKAL